MEEATVQAVTLSRSGVVHESLVFSRDDHTAEDGVGGARLHQNTSKQSGERNMLAAGVGTLMLLPLVTGGICFILSAKATEEIGK